MITTTTASAPTASHTPGPWRVEVFDGPMQYASIEAGSEINDLIRVCDIPSWPGAIEEMEANARLIAAAPDMLAALQWAESCLVPYVHAHSPEERDHAYKDAAHALTCMRAASAKATASDQT